MERLKKIVEELRSRRATDQEILNTVREYLQTLILKIIYQSPAGAALSFMGGTCLRICYNLKRYSEDLGFALDGDRSSFGFATMLENLQRELRLLGFDISTTAPKEKIVLKTFLRFAGFAGSLGLPLSRQQEKLHIKLEADANPPPILKEERESFFVNRFGEIFPILKHSLPVMFAGKILAILQRPYPAGRDYYDLIWYLSRKTEVNLDFLNRGLKGTRFQDKAALMEAVRKKVREVQPSAVLTDISRFLEDPTEADWISRYQELFDQLANARKS